MSCFDARIIPYLSVLGPAERRFLRGGYSQKHCFENTYEASQSPIANSCSDSGGRSGACALYIYIYIGWLLLSRTFSTSRASSLQWHCIECDNDTCFFWYWRIASILKKGETSAVRLDGVGGVWAGHGLNGAGLRNWVQWSGDYQDIKK